MQLIPNYPNELILAIFLFVISPSLFAMYLRYNLYLKLANKVEIVRKLIRDNQAITPPAFLNAIINRFKDASNKLEQVNTIAIVEQLYSQEKLGKFTYDKIDYFCRLLPNLLLAFGLFGTFLGITFNLSILSQQLNSPNANIESLLQDLQKPLQGMSIAFVTSLMGLLFSSILILFNFFFNTNLLKYRLFSYLEDYLDNIYLPKIQGDSRLDKIVNKMVSQQEEFLTNFGKTVRRAVEDSMGTVANQITEGNRKATELAERVYERFLESASTISGAADKFRLTIDSLEQKALIFKQAADTFEKSNFSQLLSEATKDLTNTQKDLSKSAKTLAKTSDLIQNALQEVKSCSQALLKVGEEVKSVNQTSIDILQLETQNQTLLSEIIPQLQQGASAFSTAINKLNKLEDKISRKADSFLGVEQSLYKLLEEVINYTGTIEKEIALVSRQISQDNQYLLTNWEGHTNQIGVKIDTLNLDLSSSLKENITQLQVCVKSLNSVNQEVSDLRYISQQLLAQSKVKIVDKPTQNNQS